MFSNIVYPFFYKVQTWFQNMLAFKEHRLNQCIYISLICCVPEIYISNWYFSIVYSMRGSFLFSRIKRGTKNTIRIIWRSHYNSNSAEEVSNIVSYLCSATPLYLRSNWKIIQHIRVVVASCILVMQSKESTCIKLGYQLILKNLNIKWWCFKAQQQQSYPVRMG